MNLAPAGTGSETLSAALHAADAKGLWHHSHDVRPIHGIRKGKRCFIMTLRDPAARLASGWRFDIRGHHELDQIFHRSGPRLTLAEFVAAMGNVSSIAYPSTMRNYWSSVALPTPQVFNSPYAPDAKGRPGPWWATPDLGRAGVAVHN